MQTNNYILGISCYFHDSSICVLKNGEIVFAIEEEKISRKKHDAGFPHGAIAESFKHLDIDISQIDSVIFYEKPFLKFENFIRSYISVWPLGILGFIRFLKQWLSYKLFIIHTIRKKLGFQGEIHFSEHHLSHAAGAFYSSNFHKSALLVIDGVGEDITTSWGVGEDNAITLQESIQYPHSLGLLYSCFTSYLGFAVNDGEYKIMGLAPYGKPIYVDTILENIMSLHDDGNFELNMKYFSFQYGTKMYNKRFQSLFGNKAREKNSDITQFHKDIAASIQQVMERIILQICHYIYNQTGLDSICISGGVGLNCVINTSIFRNTDFKDIFIQPSPGDGGASVGAALFLYYDIWKNPRKKSFSTIYLGSQFGDDSTSESLKKYEEQIEYIKLTDTQIFSQVAKLIDDNKIIGWFRGRTEFGPRALGNRSIIGNPIYEENWKDINLKIKFRESFRPFAPSILEEEVNNYFHDNIISPYMLFVAEAKERKSIPSVVHIDDSARLQTISSTQNSDYYNLIKEFHKISGIPILINTSFNLSGDPIVNTPNDALETFISCGLDCLVLENYLITKK